jgi:hypothetical protein
LQLSRAIVPGNDGIETPKPGFRDDREGTNMAANTPSITPPPAQPAPAGQPAKKKTSPLVWILAGCGGLIVIGVIVMLVGGYFVAHKVKGYAEMAKKNPAMAAAKLAVSFNPNLEIVSEDDDKGTLTIRDKKTGEEITMNAEDIKQGRLKFKNKKGEEVTLEGSTEAGKEGFRVKTDKGTMSFGNTTAEAPPSRVPVYPGAKAVASSRQKTEEGLTGTFTFQTRDAGEKVLAFYEKELKGAGFEVERAGTWGMANLSAKSGDGKSKVNVVVLPVSEVGTNVTVEYESS